MDENEKKEPSTFESAIKAAESQQVLVNGADHSADPARASIFSPANLTYEQDFSEEAGNEVPGSIPVRKPPNNKWFRIIAIVGYSARMGLLFDKENRSDPYFVIPELHKKLDGVKGVTVYLWVTVDGKWGLWPVKLEVDEWSNSANEIVKQAMTHWMKLLEWKAGDTRYKWKVSPNQKKQPETPDAPFVEFLERGFKGRTIDSVTHPKFLEVMTVQDDSDDDDLN